MATLFRLCSAKGTKVFPCALRVRESADASANKYFFFAPISRIFLFELWKITQSSIIAQIDGYFWGPTLKVPRKLRGEKSINWVSNFLKDSQKFLGQFHVGQWLNSELKHENSWNWSKNIIFIDIFLNFAKLRPSPKLSWAWVNKINND